jgi:hypothetical protein
VGITGNTEIYVLCGFMEIFNVHAGYRYSKKKKKGKAIPVTGRGGPYDCETSRLPQFLDNRLTDCRKFVGLTRRPAALYPQEDS